MTEAADATKIGTNPPKWVNRDSKTSNRAICTCEDCGAKHKGFQPDQCLNCEGTDLDWSYAYGYPGRFA